MGLKSLGFPKTFYVANTMEIFERLAWYGFFTLSSLYMTTPIAQGGVGFTEEQRGALQGIVPFFLYLLPVVTGALADRYGYRKMFILAFAIMTPSYYLLGQTTSFSGFFLAFTAVALGAAFFKPVVQGTITHTTNDSNRGLGFGIFYTMVNVGGFIGPLVAGYMRAISWDAVFIMSALWISLNFIPVIFLYKDPDGVKSSSSKLSETLAQAQQVLGNTRFALLVFPCIFLLMGAGSGFIEYQNVFLFSAIWIVLNIGYDKIVKPSGKGLIKQPIRISNLPFALYLGILTGFWAIYNQLFYTMPIYIRDFVDTRDLVDVIAIFGQGAVDFFAQVNQQHIIDKLAAVAPTQWDAAAVANELIHLKVRVPVEEVTAGLTALGTSPDAQQLATLANQWTQDYRQVNPEYIINLDFMAIVICQIGVSYVCQKFKTINVLVVGVLVFAIACLAAALSNSIQVGGIVAVIVVLMMAFGEMITAPKSQEYVASIAPKQQAALYMGYYFVSMALGFLFAGLLSGWAYGELAKAMGRPDLMWSLFMVIGLVTSFGLLWFNRHYVKKTD